jgi:hypothetical protein
VLAFVSINVWRSFISRQAIDVKRHLFREQAVAYIISFIKNSSLGNQSTTVFLVFLVGYDPFYFKLMIQFALKL